MMTRVIIIGGGLAGGLAALAMARRTDVDLLLLEQQPRFGGNHTWSFFDTDIARENRWLVENLIESRWPDHEVSFPRRRRTIPIGYNSIRSPALDRAIKSALRPDQYRLGVATREAGPKQVTLAGGERLDADAVIDARGTTRTESLDLCWQKFLGCVFDFPAGHGVSRPVIMDATVEQQDGYRFLYLLPLTRLRLLIEDTYYSASPHLDTKILRERIDKAASRTGSGAFELVEQESGVLPVVLDGDFSRFWPEEDRVPRLGVAGGFFHPTTSYSLPDAVANAALLAKERDLSSEALARLTRSRAERLWQERSFYRLLNRMLFRAAEPRQAYKVLEHFYRLPADVIARFYAARLTSIDKLRIVSGKPPVPIRRALRAALGHAA